MTMTVMMILHLIRRFHCNRSNCESRAYSFSPSHQSDDDDDDDHDNGNNDENGDDNELCRMSTAPRGQRGTEY